MDEQHKVIDYLKSQGSTKMFQILIVVDMFAGDPSFIRNRKVLHQLYIRGRHCWWKKCCTTYFGAPCKAPQDIYGKTHRAFWGALQGSQIFSLKNFVLYFFRTRPAEEARLPAEYRLTWRATRRGCVWKGSPGL